MKCNSCESEDFQLLYKGNIDHKNIDRFSQYKYYSDIYKCKNCGLICQKMDHEVDTIIEKISNEKYLDEEIGQLNIEEKHIQFNQLIKIMENFVDLNNAKVLDAGANTGVFLNQMKNYTQQVHGVEPSVEAVENAKKLFNIDIDNNIVSKAQFADNSFDIITMWDVIEHLTDPAGDLKYLYSKLKNNGTIFVSTHNIGDFVLNLTKEKYPLFMYQHFYHFSIDSLSDIFKKAGFQVVGVQKFCKSWSIGYLYELIDKQWPDNSMGTVLKSIFKPLVGRNSIKKSVLKLPVPHFFVLVGRKVED